MTFFIAVGKSILKNFSLIKIIFLTFQQENTVKTKNPPKLYTCYYYLLILIIIKYYTINYLLLYDLQFLDYIDHLTELWTLLKCYRSYSNHYASVNIRCYSGWEHCFALSGEPWPLTGAQVYVVFQWAAHPFWQSWRILRKSWKCKYWHTIY